MISQDNPDNRIPRNIPQAKIPVIPLSYHGQAGEVLKLHIVNLLLNIITLGIYSFWGKTRIRRYMTSHISIAQDRFEYTGTGKELFFGAIKALLIFLPIAICMGIPFVQIFAYILFLGLLAVALFLALRYRLSRTRWRGIRFALGGSIKEYFVLAIKRTLINVVTLGWKIPQSDLMKWSYIANHMAYGDIKFSYEGDARRIKKIHLITFAIFMLAIVVGFTSFGLEIAQTIEERQASPGKNVPSFNPVAVFSLYGGLALGFFSRIWYYAALWQEKFRGLRIGKLRFKIYVTGPGLAKLYVVNFLLVIFTLGIAKPIAAHRTLRYYVTNLKIGGDVNELIAEQAKLSEKSGFGDALAADVGFDMGL